ncbi:hypothetical protein D9613_011115 [Agrocybe pediades]|uniref:Uncharacterized protein n=1 Tax=Agrocybe pediades TaxID=84607 RepID=A0A8H4QL27_9AGAR|nr:hypothetical protein D9613_011115 [Agrocybe pediades]
MSSNQKFTAKEQQEIQHLQEVINSGAKTSVNEKQIAEAKLYDLEKSKEPAPHNHKHRVQGDVGGETKVTSSNMMHNDEAFEKFEMGGDSSYHRGSGSAGSKVLNQAASDQQSVLMNHKASGHAKERSNETIQDNEFSLHGPQ